MNAFKTLFIAAAGLTLATTASAQTGPIATACKAELEKNCAGKSGDETAAKTCLESSKAKLSKKCKKALKAAAPAKKS